MRGLGAITLIATGLFVWNSTTYIDTGKTNRGIRFQDVQGRNYQLENLSQKGAAVVVFLSTDCPAVPRYAPRLNQMSKQFKAQGAQFVGVYPNEGETAAKVKDHAKRMGFQFPVVLDSKGDLMNYFHATHTPQVFVLDARGQTRYNGAIDSATKQANPQHTYLKDAVQAVLAKKTVKTAKTEVIGCFLKPASAESAGSAKITYAEHIAPILFKNCTNCHHPGNIGPFPLQTYDDAKRWAKEIKFYTQRRAMPPWKPEAGWGEFAGNRQLSDEQIQMIADWVDAGAPAGDMKRAPKLPKFSNEWGLGQPDLIVGMPEPYKVEGAGEDEYRYFVIPVEVPANTFMVGIDIQPGSRDVVHHANVFVDTSGSARRLDEADPKPGYSNFGSPGFVPSMMLGGWVPGMRPMKLQTGYGVLLPQKFDIVMQVHYFKGKGITANDLSKVGLYFSKKEETIQPVQLVVISNSRFRIPPGDSRHEVAGRWKTPADRSVKAVAIMAHMHLVARETQVEAITADKQVIPLLKIGDWDFNWQETYFYKEPIELPPNTEIKAVGFYDNSEGNPRNPNSPPKEVRYGDKTTDEMFFIFLAIADEKMKSSFLIPASF